MTDSQPDEDQAGAEDLIYSARLSEVLPADRMMLVGVDCPEPTFSPSEMAKMFFDKTGYWVRERERRGFFELDGKPVGRRRTASGYGRTYTLSDVEEIAHALAQKGAISTTQLRQTLLLVMIRAEMSGYL